MSKNLLQQVTGSCKVSWSPMLLTRVIYWVFQTNQKSKNFRCTPKKLHLHGKLFGQKNTYILYDKLLVWSKLLEFWEEFCLKSVRKVCTNFCMHAQDKTIFKRISFPQLCCYFAPYSLKLHNISFCNFICWLILKLCILTLIINRDSTLSIRWSQTALEETTQK